MVGSRSVLHAILLAAGIAGCAGPTASSSAEATTTPTPEATSSPSSPGSTAPSAGASAEAEIFRLGTSTLTPRNSRMTVYAFGPTDRETSPPDGSAWYAADIEFCLAPQIKSVVPVAELRYEYGVESVGGQLTRPESSLGGPTELFADPDRTMVADECVRGDVVFPVRDDDPAKYVGLFVGLGERRWEVAP
jgi:hypothetical protein